MRTTMKWLAFGLLIGLLPLTGCEAPPQEMPYQTMDLAEPVDILHQVVGGHPALTEPGLKLIDSQAELDVLGVDDLIGRPVNFNNEQVILATLGEMPTDGYWIRISAVHQEGDALYVYGQANRPGPDDAVGQVLTYPYCAVVIPRTTATHLRDRIESVEGQQPLQ